MTARPMIAMLLLAPLAACGTPAAPDGDTGGTTNATTPETTGSVQREIVAPPEPATPPPLQQTAIQTQPGPGGSQVALNKVAVTGDVLTVQVTYTGTSANTTPRIDQVSIIDDATAQRIGVLKDNDGKYLAAPTNAPATDLAVYMSGKPVIAWFKFPAPPATSRTVSLNIPEVAPFDGVPVTR